MVPFPALADFGLSRQSLLQFRSRPALPDAHDLTDIISHDLFREFGPHVLPFPPQQLTELIAVFEREHQGFHRGTIGSRRSVVRPVPLLRPRNLLALAKLGAADAHHLHCGWQKLRTLDSC